MTIENHAISNEPSDRPAWLVIAGILIALIGVGMVMDHFASVLAGFVQ